jgi:Zn ribbon nucleic-acid-binding protein
VAAKFTRMNTDLSPYVTKMSTEITQEQGSSYRDGWADYITRRNMLIFIFLGYLPWGVLIFLAKQYLGLPTRVAEGLIIAWFIAFPIAGVRYQLWKCPRCRKGFAYTWWYNKSFFARKCVHCDLSKGEIATIARHQKQNL